jgi:hypothetical protein
MFLSLLQRKSLNHVRKTGASLQKRYPAGKSAYDRSELAQLPFDAKKRSVNDGKRPLYSPQQQQARVVAETA